MARVGSETIRRSIHGLLHKLPDDAATDGELLDRFVDRADEAAFTLLVGRHGRLVYNACLRILRNAADADDAFQAAFFVLARKAGAIRKRASVASWLYGVAYRIALRAKVARSRAPAQGALTNDEVAMAPHDSTDGAWRELRPLLDGEMDRLPEIYRAPLLLCYFEGKSNEEAARQLGWPCGTVKGRLARARVLLRDRLARRGVNLSTAALTACLTEQAMAAPVPTHLVSTTVSATMTVAAGEAAAAGALSARAAAFAKGESHSMFLTNLKIVTAALICTGVGAWATIGGYQAWAERPS